MSKETKKAVALIILVTVLAAIPLYYYFYFYDKPTNLPLTDEDYATMPPLVETKSEDDVLYDTDRFAPTAVRELGRIKEAGILAEKVSFCEEDIQYMEIDEPKVLGPEYGNRELGQTCYISASNADYSISMRMDTETEKIIFLNVEARSDAASPEQVSAEDVSSLVYADNFEDVIKEDLNVEKMCDALCSYWGFNGWTLADTYDEMYDMDMNAPDNDVLIKDLATDNYYMTVYFDGDMADTPMFVQSAKYPKGVCVLFGTGHLVG